MGYHFLETLLNVDSPAARSERPYEFPDSVPCCSARDARPGRRKRRACASTTTRSRPNSRPTSPPDHGSRQGQVHGPAGSERRRLRTAQRPARHQGSRRKEPAALRRARHPGFHRARAAARRLVQRRLHHPDLRIRRHARKRRQQPGARASSWPTSATTPAICSMPDAGSRSADSA